MDTSTIWWLAAGILVGLELATGTFYLLMLAIGMVGAALGSHLGLPVSSQISIAAVVGAGSAVALYVWRGQQDKEQKSSHPDDNQQNSLDSGQWVEVTAQAISGHTAQVQYRGAAWQAVSTDGSALQVGHYTIARVDGNRLVLSSAPVAATSAS